MCKVVAGMVLFLLIICAYWDCRKKQIPVALLLLMTGIVIVSLFCKEESIYSKIGGALIGILFFAVSRCTKEAIGYGDSWIILNLGIVLGLYKLIQVVFWAAFAAGIFSLFLLWKHKWKKRETVPFVPFLTFACLGVMVT